MSTQPPNAIGQDDDAEGTGFDTALIARLANEFFAESHGSPRAVAAPPASFPSEPSHPTFPSAIGGLPGALPGTPTVPSVPAGRTSEHGLTGGFPAAAPASSQPVHPVVQSETPAQAESDQETRSGGHEPGARDSHPFGEPRCDGKVFDKSSSRNSRTAGSAGSDETPAGVTSLPGYEQGTAPEFYFLRAQDAAPHGGSAFQPDRAPKPSLSVFDVEAVRRDFPALHQKVNGHPLIWLDNAATTHKPQAVIDATSRFYGRDNSNIHRAAHTLAARSTELFEAGREKVRQFLGASDAKEIIFVRGTTEAINLVAQSYGRSNVGPGDEIIVSEIEHHANIVPWQLLAQQTGATLRVIPIDDRGELILEEYVKLLGPRTKIVSVTHVSNALGTINPIEQIIPLAHARGIPVLVDGAQSAPHIPIDVTALDADFFAFSAHKIFGPTGIGALYGKASLLEQMPPWQGGGHMIKDVSFARTTYNSYPEKFEAGTPDIAGVVGLGATVDYLFSVGLPAIAAYEHALLEYATQALSTVPGVRPIGTATHKASVLSFVIPGVPNEHIARHLDKRGIAVRAGHHCAQPAIRHFGLESTVRPSLAFYNTYAEVDVLVAALHQLPKP